jgi:hypothetical protein
MDELYDPSKFLITYPLWLVYNIEIMAEKGADEFSAFARVAAGYDNGEEETCLPSSPTKT